VLVSFTTIKLKYIIKDL